MSAQKNNIKAFFETNESELQIENEINLYNGLSIEYDFNNSDLTSNFSLAIDLTSL
jgi:hypothetical protein